MANELVPLREIEKHPDEIFSEYTHPALEDFIQKVINQNRDALPTIKSQKLVREFFLYGFLKASGYEFNQFGEPCTWRGGLTKLPNYGEKGAGKFCTNNGILALCDFDGEIYIRGGDSYHGYFDFGRGEEPQGVEGTLLNSGYESRDIWVPHSNGDIFADPRREKLFRVLHHFSRQVRQLRGEPTSGLIIKDLSEPEPEAPYRGRDPSLPRIELGDLLLIPGNKERIISVRK